jgi:hypothetical protein
MGASYHMSGLVQFDYLREVAVKYGDLARIRDATDQFIHNLTEEQRSELASAHELIERRGDAPRISEWFYRCAKSESGFAIQVRGLFKLFERLGEKDIRPFSSRTVQFVEEPPKEPNWSNLPEELEYLIEPAMKYGRHQGLDEVNEFLRNASEDDLEELACVAERIRLNDHNELIGEFMDRYPMPEHTEAARLYFLLGLLEPAGVQPEDKDWNTVERHIEALSKHGSFRLASERMWAARFLAEFGEDASPAIPHLQKALQDEDLRVRVWAHYALAVLQGDCAKHLKAVREIFAQHNQKDELDLYDEIGEQAHEVLDRLRELERK